MYAQFFFPHEIRLKSFICILTWSAMLYALNYSGNEFVRSGSNLKFSDINWFSIEKRHLAHVLSGYWSGTWYNKQGQSTECIIVTVLCTMLIFNSTSVCSESQRPTLNSSDIFLLTEQ